MQNHQPTNKAPTLAEADAIVAAIRARKIAHLAVVEQAKAILAANRAQSHQSKKTPSAAEAEAIVALIRAQNDAIADRVEAAWTLGLHLCDTDAVKWRDCHCGALRIRRPKTAREAVQPICERGHAFLARLAVIDIYASNQDLGRHRKSCRQFSLQQAAMPEMEGPRS